VYDKTVRRRRAVLGLLVACSLILLTAYFGETGSGALHGVQRGTSEILNPIQEGASRALKPVRDLFGWAGDTLDAKGQLKSVRRDRDALRSQLVATQAKLRDSAQLKDQELLNRTVGLADNAPVRARVIAKDPNLWFDQVTIDEGTGSGIQRNQAVINGQGLVGRVTEVTGSTAIVTLITNHTTEIGVEAGHPTDLVLGSLSSKDEVSRNQIVVTSGTTSKVGRYPSPYPRDIPIGRVTRVDDLGTDDEQAHVAPFADLRRLDLVEVLTKRDAG
jgi:rod shape-determining protein MreC